MKQYLDLIREVLRDGSEKKDRTGIGTISKFGVQSRYDLRDGFPLVTTKKTYFKGIVYEMLWFIKGDTNIKFLVDHNVNIWNEWPYEAFKNTKDYKGETIDEFIAMIKVNKEFAEKYGNLGPVYGKQWRNFDGIDQLKKVVIDIKNNPNSRSHIISAWNPAELHEMALYPCHSMFQFYVTDDGFIDLQLYQRSGDIFLGIPFNIASYSLLLILMALECNLKPRYFIHSIGDAHIYNNHFDQVNLQISRSPLLLPTVNVKNFKSLFEVAFDDIELIGYQSHPAIKGAVAV